MGPDGGFGLGGLGRGLVGFGVGSVGPVPGPGLGSVTPVVSMTDHTSKSMPMPKVCLCVGMIGYAAAPAISRHRDAQRRHSSAQGPHNSWCGACCSQASAQASQTSAQSRHSDSAIGESRLIQFTASEQMSAHSRQRRMQRAINSRSPCASMPIMSSLHVLHMLAQAWQAEIQALYCWLIVRL